MNISQGQKIAPFISTLLIYQLFLAVLLFIYGYKGSFLFLNGAHHNWLDLPMFFLTHLGDSLILTSLLCFVFIRKYPELVILLIIVVLVTGLTGQLMKNYLFDSWDRPLSVFGENGNVYTIFGYRLFQNSFPSGHSITVASVITSVVITLKPSVWKMVGLGMFVALVSYTRVYVGAHFAGDVLAGTIIGVAGAMFLTLRLYPGIKARIEQKSVAGLRKLKTTLLVLAIAGFAIGILMIGEYLKKI